MTQADQKFVRMLEMLPEGERGVVSQLIRRMALVRDSETTKLTSEERKRLQATERRICERRKY